MAIAEEVEVMAAVEAEVTVECKLYQGGATILAISITARSTHSARSTRSTNSLTALQNDHDQLNENSQTYRQ